MRRLLALLLPLTLLAATLLAQPRPKGTTYVFLVAVSQYDKPKQFSKLPFTVRETEEFRRLLVESKVADEANIRFLCDRMGADDDERFAPRKDNILDAFDTLARRMKPEDTLIVALDGHGIQPDKSTAYFCPADADLKWPESMIALEGEGGLYERLKNAPPKRKLLLVNACRDDPQAPNARQAANKVNFDTGYRYKAPEGIAAIFSCEPGQFTYYYPAKEQVKSSPGHPRSLFFHHLLEAWRGGYAPKGRAVTLEDVFKEVQERTAKDADSLFGEPQNPVIERKYSGSWFVRAEGETPAADAKVGHKIGDAIDIPLTDKVKMKACWVPPGDSWLGGGGGKEGTTKFTLAEGLWCGKYPVTQEEWETVMGDNPSEFKGNPRYPVESVSWDTVQKFIEKVNEKSASSGYVFRLPTEEEWEYICRGGPLRQSQSGYEFYFAKSTTALTSVPTNDLSSKQANFNGDPAGKVEKGPYLKRPSKVGSYLPNPLGIYDHIGNVWQWTSSLEGSRRVIRSGSWSHNGENCSASRRYWVDPSNEDGNLGFRLLAVPSGAK